MKIRMQRGLLIAVGAVALAGCNRSDPTPERQHEMLEPAPLQPAPDPASNTGTSPEVGTNAGNPTVPGAAGGGSVRDADPAGANDKLDADVDLKTAEGIKLDAEAELTEVANGVKIVLEVEDAPPGKKAVHIHEKGDCSNIPGKSMGNHFAPHGEPHGLPDSPKRHPGDLGNIEIGKDGKGRLEIVATGASLRAGHAVSFRDKAIVMHESSDKGTQPSGDAGKPIACGEIRVD